RQARASGQPHLGALLPAVEDLQRSQFGECTPTEQRFQPRVAKLTMPEDVQLVQLREPRRTAERCRPGCGQSQVRVEPWCSHMSATEAECEFPQCRQVLLLGKEPGMVVADTLTANRESFEPLEVRRSDDRFQPGECWRARDFQSR